MDKEKDTRTFAEKHPKLNLVIGLIMLILIALAGFVLLKTITVKVLDLIVHVSQLTSKMDAVIIVALITGTVSIVTVVFSSVIGKVIEYKQRRKEYLYQKREEPYSEFVEVVYKMMDKTRLKEDYITEEMMLDINKFSKKLTLWGSNRVINKWLKFRTSSQLGKSNPGEILFEMEEILYAMRKDLGLRKMKQGNLLSFFINDIEKIRK